MKIPITHAPCTYRQNLSTVKRFGMSAQNMDPSSWQIRFTSPLAYAYLKDFSRLAQQQGTDLDTFLNIHGMTSETTLLAKTCQDDFYINDLRIPHTAGEGLWPTYDDARRALLEGFRGSMDLEDPEQVNVLLTEYELDTAEKWQASQDRLINQLVEAPCRNLVKRLLKLGKYPIASNAYNVGRKGVTWVNQRFLSAGANKQPIFFTPLSSSTQT